MMHKYKKKILVIGPILPKWSEIKYITKTLDFLKEDYSLTFIDPLDALDAELTTIKYYERWSLKLNKKIERYDVFIGFSLGGIILQHCFNLFLGKQKKIILFSTPSFSDTMLSNRLKSIIELTRESIIDAINKKNEYVFFPSNPHKLITLPSDENLKNRLVSGLRYVLESDSRKILKESKVKYMHFIGRESMLVNENNVFASELCHLKVVPNAGMRVLQDNPNYCSNLINEYLSESK